MKKKLIILSIIGIVLIGIIGGASFAYFSTANNIGNENVVTSGTMSLLFTDGQEVSANNLIPGEYIEKTFKVKNTGNVDTRYDVYFSEVINTFVDKTDLVYTLTSNDGGYNTTNEVQVPSTETKIVNQQLITPNAEHTYTLRITFKLKQTIQNANMGRTFTAKININEYNTNTQEKLLKLIDASGNEIDKQIVGASQTNYTLALSNTDLTSSTNIYCNNGGIPTISGNTLNVSGITNDTICTISNDIVDTFNNKQTTTKTGIVMTNNQSGVTTMTVPASKEVVLDLNGKNIISESVNDTTVAYDGTKAVITDYGNLTVNDVSNSGLMQAGSNYSTIYIGANGNLEVNGGYYIGGSTIYTNANSTNANIDINNGTFDSTYRYNFGLNGCTNCKFNIDNAKITETGYGSCSIYEWTDDPNSEIEINDGDYNIDDTAWIICSGGSNKGTVTVNGGDFTQSTTNVIGFRTGTLNINGGNFTNTVNRSVLVTVSEQNGTININDGNFHSNESYLIEHVTNSTATININGGTFESNTYGLYNNGGVLNINDGTFNTKTLTVANGKGTTNIYGGRFISDCSSISSTLEYPQFSSATLIQVKPGNGIINVYGGYFESKTGYGIRNNSAGVINIKDASVKTYDYEAVYNGADDDAGGGINICKLSILNNKGILNNANGYIYYHTNAFGSVTPTFGGGNPSGIQVKDSVCN